MRPFGYLLLLATILCGCVSQSKYDKALSTIDSLQTENARLIALNDELENGESRLINQYLDCVAKGNYIQAETAYNTLTNKYPNSLSNPAVSNIAQVKKRAKSQQDSIERAVRDSLFLANLDNIGNWQIGNFVNDFDEPTGEHFVYQQVLGEFSNSATSGSRLSVRIQIFKSAEAPIGSLKSSYSSKGVYYKIVFDEYADGTKDGLFFRNTKIVSKEQRKVYLAPHYGSYFEEKDGDGKKLDFLDVLRIGSTYEITDISPSVKYYFTINSQYLDNALVKAGLLSPNDILKY